MIFATQESIVKYTKLGVWNDTTLIDYFKAHVKANSDKMKVRELFPVSAKSPMTSFA